MIQELSVMLFVVQEMVSLILFPPIVEGALGANLLPHFQWSILCRKWLVRTYFHLWLIVLELKDLHKEVWVSFFHTSRAPKEEADALRRESTIPIVWPCNSLVPSHVTCVSYFIRDKIAPIVLSSLTAFFFTLNSLPLKKWSKKKDFTKNEERSQFIR